MVEKFFKRWLRVGDRWQNLHGFFQISGARFFIAWFALTPAAAKILEQLPVPLVLTTHNGPISIQLSLPFNWVVLWFASFSYAIGFVWFHSRCPAFIKKHPNFIVYQAYGHSPRWLVTEAEIAWRELSQKQKQSFARRLVKKKIAKKTTKPPVMDEKSDNTERQILSEHTEWSFQYLSDWYTLTVNENETETTVNDIFWEIFARHSEDRQYSRYFIWGLSTLACLLTFWVLIQNIAFVLNYLGS